MQEMKQTRRKSKRGLATWFLGINAFKLSFFSPHRMRWKKHAHLFSCVERFSYPIMPQEMYVCGHGIERKCFKSAAFMCGCLAVGGDGEAPREDVVVQPADLGHSYCTFGSYNLRELSVIAPLQCIRGVHLHERFVSYPPLLVFLDPLAVFAAF